MMPSSALQNYHCHYSFFFFSTQNCFFLPRAAGGRGQAQHPVPSEGCCTGPSPLAHNRGTAVLPRSLSLDAAAAPGGLGCAPRTPTRPRLQVPAGEQVTRRWPTGGPSPRALSEPGWPTPSHRPPPLGRPLRVPGRRTPAGTWGSWRRPFREQGFQIQVSFSPKAYARYLRYPCEWRRKTKTQQSLSQMPVLLNIRRLLNSLDVRVSPTKQPF